MKVGNIYNCCKGFCMSNLRTELNKFKQERAVHINEAAYAWAENNIILINEKMDRRNVKRLSDAILKFDEKFGPFKDKIPAIASQLDTAENNLQLVLTGRVNDEKASDMLQQLSFLYRVFSDFFSVDLPIILNTNIFDTAKQNPDVRLDSLQPGEGSKYDPKIIRDTFRHSISPSKDELRLIRKIYSKRNIPLVDGLAIANQLLTLSYNDLQNLGGMEKVPMVATNEEPVSESVELNESILKEVDIQKLRKLNADMDRLKKVFQPFGQKVPSLDGVLKQMGDQLSQVQANAGSGAWDKVKGFFGGGVEKNILATHDIFKKFKEVAVEAMRMMDGANPNATLQDLLSDGEYGQRANNILNLLGKAVKPGIFGKSSIDPTTFKNEISQLTISEIDSLARGIELSPTDAVDPEISEPATPEEQPVDNTAAAQAAPIPATPRRNAGPVAPIELPAEKGTTIPPVAAPAPGAVTSPEIAPTPAPTADAAAATPPVDPAAAPVTTNPGTALSSDEVVQAISSKKKINPKLQKDLKAAVDWLSNNGFKVTQ